MISLARNHAATPLVLGWNIPQSTQSPTAAAWESLSLAPETFMKRKSFPKPKICTKINEIPVWAKHSTGDMSSKEAGYTSKLLLNTQVKMEIQGQDLHIWEMKIYNLPSSPTMEHHHKNKMGI